VKKLQHNNGFTLIELMVSIAILALIMVAIAGIMYSNNVIFRKTKSDIVVQDDAQSVYNKINDDLMQAKHVYIEGYTSDVSSATPEKVEFVSNKPGKEDSASLVSYKFMLPTDKYVIKQTQSQGKSSVKEVLSGNFERDLNSQNKMLEAMPTEEERNFYKDLLATPKSDIVDKMENLPASDVDAFGPLENIKDTYYKLTNYSKSEHDAYRDTLNDTERALYDSYWNRFRYIDDAEIAECESFLNPLKSNTDAIGFENLKIQSTGEYRNLYITKLVIEYSIKVDNSFTDSVTTEKMDQVLVTYTFGDENNPSYIYVDYDYKYMNKLDSSHYQDIGGNTLYDNNILSKKLNYAKCDGKVIPGCEAQVDADNNSMKLFLYFADNSMSYTDRGMVQVRNSYVLHDAK